MEIYRFVITIVIIDLCNYALRQGVTRKRSTKRLKHT